MTIIRDDGVSKFKLTLKRAPAPEMTQVIALEKWRALFFKLGLIGEYPTTKIGFGNLSSRLSKSTFLITGTQTGHLPHLQAHHYTKVIDCDLKKGSVSAEGLIPPSTESLTHFSIYEANPSIKFIFHVHHSELLDMLKGNTFDQVDVRNCNTSQELAQVLSEFLNDKSSGVFALKDHEDGIISFGTTAEEVGRTILDLYRKLSIRQ